MKTEKQAVKGKQVMVSQRMIEDMDALGTPYSVGPDGKTFRIQLAGFPARAKTTGPGSSTARTPAAPQAASPTPCQAKTTPQGQETGLMAAARRRAAAFQAARERDESSRAARRRRGDRNVNPQQSR